MTLPSAAMGLVCALLIGALFHLAVDGGVARLLLYLLLSTLGFLGGHWLGLSQDWTFMSVGPLRLGPAVAGSLLALLLGNWLSQVRIENTARRDRV